MAQSRKRGDEFDNARDGVGKAGKSMRADHAAPEQRGHASGQQSGGKRPAAKTGAAKRAPKKGD